MKKNRNGFTMIELLGVLIILALLIILISRPIIKMLGESKEKIAEQQEKAIVNAAEKWSVDNSVKFDKLEGSTIQIGLDVVFVIDVSGSMSTTMSSSSGNIARYKGVVSALNPALEILRQSNVNRVGYVFYSSGIIKTMNLTPVENIEDIYLTSTYYYVYDGNISNKIDARSGNTYTQSGMQEAAKMLRSSVTGNQTIPVIVLLSDGEANYTGAIGTDPYEVIPYYKPGSTSTINPLVISNTTYSVTRTVQTGKIIKETIPTYFGANLYFYTIGLGVSTTNAKFVLDPSTTNYNSLTSAIKTEMNKISDYNYPTKSFIDGNMNEADLKNIFSSIVTEVTEAAKVVQVCVTVQDLYDGGYLSTKDIKLANDEATSQYVIMTQNEATNQYGFSLAKEQGQIDKCKELLEGTTP